jgi:hypothetical protein
MKNMKTLTLNELLKPLRYTDERAARDWCIQNKVLITKIGKFEVVFEAEFQLEYERPYINKLKNKFGDGWEQVYNLYKDGNIPALYTLSDLTSKSVSIFKSNSNIENKFIKKLEDYELKKKNAA